MRTFLREHERLLTALLISVLLHALINWVPHFKSDERKEPPRKFVFELVAPNSNPSSRRSEKHKSAPHKITLDKNANSSPNRADHNPSPESSASVPRADAAISKSNRRGLNLNLQPGDFQALRHSNETARSAHAPQDDDETEEWGKGAFEFTRVEDFGLMNRIYERIDDGLFYPSVLASHQIQGSVRSRLVLNGEGRCDWDRSNIQSSETHLRVFVLSVLKEVCQGSYKKFIRERQTTNVDLLFNFEITEHNDPTLIEKRKSITGNVLSFYRNSQKSVAEWHLGPFQGIFPIPFVSVDFGWLTDHWDQIRESKDPLAEYRER